MTTWNKDHNYKCERDEWVSRFSQYMTTLHTGDEVCEETPSADNAEDVPAQPALETSADSADETEPEPAELNESSDEMERSLPAPTPFNADASDLYTEWKHWMSAFESTRLPQAL